MLKPSTLTFHPERMPPKKIKKVVPQTLTVSCFSRGSGMTAGLELWSASLGGSPPKFLLYDRSPDGRFAGDVATWNGAAATAGGLTPATLVSFAEAAAVASV
jgi:hypothetical protein